MSDSPQASVGVFLSYAREDSDAARRIADALRAFGVEVWFDQSELRGGDAWDQKIKKQIRECALFVLVVSENTQARGEGYFRREWKLAVERTHDMASNKAFLIPVVVDDTLESEALVPEELMRVQWTRMPHGIPTPQFVEQIKRLLETPKARSVPIPRAVAPSAPVQVNKRIPIWVWLVVPAVLVIAVVVVKTRQWSQPAVTSVAPPPSPAIVTPRKADDKSVAVLPFDNMSEDKDNAFFADGIHEDILTNLAQIKALRVVSRTSVMQYRDTKKSIKEIASELGVAYILEGSVRREGNKVRVTGQLINAATDEHVWAQAYDRDLTDIFTIQGELAQSIAAALQTALSPDEKARVERRPTDNPDAYDLFLRSRDIRNNQSPDPDVLVKVRALLEKAVDLDPSFAQAWGDLADSYAFLVFLGSNGADGLLAKAKDAIDKANLYAPTDPEVISDTGTYYYYAFRDYGRATKEYQKLAEQRPNDPTLFKSLALILRRQGHWEESIANTRHAVDLEPRNLAFLRDLAGSLQYCNRYDEALAVQKRIVSLAPDDLREAFTLAALEFYKSGSMKEADDFFKNLPPEVAATPIAITLEETWATICGRWQEAVHFGSLQPPLDTANVAQSQQNVVTATAMYIAGDHAGAVALLGASPAQFRNAVVTDPKNPQNWAILGLVEAILGNTAECYRCFDRSVELVPESRDALVGPQFAQQRASVHEILGDKEFALAEYKRLLKVPNGCNVYVLKYGATSLKGDPRFEALIADPANNAPHY